MAIQRIAVLGDSVSWGQGLLDQHKYAHIVAEQLAGTVGPIVEMYAHSGAIIDPLNTLGDDVDRCDSFSCEIPVAAPSIRSQIRKVPHPETVDLVLLNGGINDVSVYRILNPLTRTQDLSRWIANACYAGMKLLLTEAYAAFSKVQVKIVLTGYYPYLSSKSDQSLIDDLLKLIGICLPGHLDADPLLQQVTRLAMQFWKESNQAFSQAVGEIGSRRVIYVPGPLQEENAVFASDPWLFGLKDGINTEDEVSDARLSACDCCYTDPLELMQHETCRIASVGHPNMTGAQKYADAILAVCS